LTRIVDAGELYL